MTVIKFENLRAELTKSCKTITISYTAIGGRYHRELYLKPADARKLATQLNELADRADAINAALETPYDDEEELTSVVITGD